MPIKSKSLTTTKPKQRLPPMHPGDMLAKEFPESEVTYLDIFGKDHLARDFGTLNQLSRDFSCGQTRVKLTSGDSLRFP